jgi:uncharacterized protein
MQQAATHNRLDDARPTILVGGKHNAALKLALLGLVIKETVQGLYRCEAVFSNWDNGDYLYFDRRTLDFGATFEVQLRKEILFSGRIMALEGIFAERPPEIVVLAEDSLQDLRMTRRTRTFLNMTDSDVFNTIAKEHGLTKDIRFSGDQHRQTLAQLNQSDLAFLRERARAIDAEVWVATGDDGRSKLSACARTDRIKSAPYKMGYRNELREFSVLADLAGQRTSVVASGWDVASKKTVLHEADESIVKSELSDGESGASILLSKFGVRKETLVHTLPTDSSEAEQHAKAYFKMSARRFVSGFGVASCDARLRVGATVDLQNLGPLFSGAYYLSEVTHRFDGTHGLRTEFVAERPGLSAARSAA